MPAYDYYDEEAKKNGKAAITTSNPAAGVPRTEENLGAPKTVVSKADNAASGASSLTGQAVGSETVNMRTNRNAATMPVNGNGIASQAMTQNMYSPEKSNLASDLTEGAASVSKWNENADFAVRNYLEQVLSIDGKRVGFDGENVTFDGNPLIKAERVSDEGRSFVSGQAAVDAAVGQYAQEHGMVAIRDYANSLGTPVNISWNGDNGTVEINGVPMKPDFISNGKAYVYQEKLDAVLKKADNGFRRSTDYLKDAYDKYGGDIEDAYNAYMNYKDFSYDQENDKAYQDFMDVYRRAVEDEYNANMAQARFRTGGLASPAVMSQAAAVRSRALDDAAKYGQQYEDRAYDRWKDTRDFTGDKLATAWDMMKGKYDLESGAEKADRDAFNEQINNDLTRQRYRQELKGGELDLIGKESDTNSKLIDNGLHDKYAATFVENEVARDFYETSYQKYVTKIMEEYGLKNAEASYVAALLANDLTKAGIEGQWISNETARKNLNWIDGLNASELAISILSGMISAKDSGVKFPAEMLTNILKKALALES